MVKQEKSSGQGRAAESGSLDQQKRKLRRGHQAVREETFGDLGIQ